MLVLVHARKSLDSYIVWDTEYNSFKNLSFEQLREYSLQSNFQIIGVVRDGFTLKVTSQPKQYFSDYLNKCGVSCDSTQMQRFIQARNYAKTLV
jgi:hypothetical protein